MQRWFRSTKASIERSANDVSPDLKRSAQTDGLTRFRLLDRMADRTIAELDKIAVQRIDIDRATGLHTFRITCDRYAAPGVLQRTSVDVRQSPTQKGGMIDPKSATLDVSSEWGRHLYDHANHDLDLLILRLTHAGLDVSSVRRGTIGPVWFDGVRAPTWIATILTSAPGNMIGEFSSTRADRLDATASSTTDGSSNEVRALLERPTNGKRWKFSEEVSYSTTSGTARALRETLASAGLHHVQIRVLDGT